MVSIKETPLFFTLQWIQMVNFFQILFLFVFLGTFCGYSDNATDYPYIYFVAPTTTTLFRTVCVKTCPTTSATSLDCLNNSMVHECTGILISEISGTTTTTTDNSTSNSSTTTTDTTTTDTTATNTTTTDETTTNSTSLYSKNSHTKSTEIKDILVTNIHGKQKAVSVKHMTTSYNYSEIVVIYPSVACISLFKFFFTILLCLY